MFGRVEGSKQVTGENYWANGVQGAVSNDALMFESSLLGVGDELTISTTQATVTPKGTDDEVILSQAPSPNVKVAGKVEIARIVVDLSKNYLYTYDEEGNPKKAYLIASGKPKTPTDKGLRKITHFEEYPYKKAPPSTVRYKNPSAFGPKLMYLVPVNPATGEKGESNGEFIHGNNKPESLGKYESGGCVRMDNDVIKELTDEMAGIPVGSYVLIQ